MRSMTLTKWLILITPLIWIAWDVYVYFHDGNPATESAVIVRWSTYAPGIAFLCGILCGHLFFSLREPISWPDNLNKKNPDE